MEMTRGTFVEMKKEYLGMETEAESISVEKALIIYSLKIKVQTDLLEEMYNMTERPPTMEVA